MSTWLDQLTEKARTQPKRVIFPESCEERVLQAARRVCDMGIAIPMLVGDPLQIQAAAASAGVSLEGMQIIDMGNEALVVRYILRFLEVCEDFSENALKRRTKVALNLAALMVRIGEADCLAAGVQHSTGDVILASQMMIGLADGISTVSSLGILEVPGFDGPQGNLLTITDCAVCPFPTSDELADIAISSADTMRRLLGWEPRVAMLTFSTKGSAQHERVDHVIRAVSIAQARRPDLKIDGEFQLDSAILPKVAARKVPGESAVAGKANILVFPSLEAGNIGVKLVQIFGHAIAHGPLLQGFARPVTDFSRSAPVEEMVGAITMMVVRAQEGSTS